jgi:diacylglycerol kinase
LHKKQNMQQGHYWSFQKLFMENETFTIQVFFFTLVISFVIFFKFNFLQKLIIIICSALVVLIFYHSEYYTIALN